MKRFLLTCYFLSWGTAASILAQDQKHYECRFEEDVPYGVSAWSQSRRVREGIGRENRFASYDAGSAAGLSNDALVDRGAGGTHNESPRATAFYQAYDDKGWTIYIESKEPLLQSLVSQLPDPRSAGHREAYELFFTPALEAAPYYQLYIQPYINKATVYDWATPGENYRSLKDEMRVESLPLKDGVGTFVFIPWRLLYEHVPVEGAKWRFTLIRWMPFSKSGGITWGGRVHETGRFGIVEFAVPTEAQKQAIELNLLRTGWYRFQAEAQRLSEYWGDEFLGDPGFYENCVKPEVARLREIGEAWGDPEKWDVGRSGEGKALLKNLMEFDYKVSAMREDYLKQKRISGK